MKKFFCSVFLFIVTANAYSQVLIITHVYNRPDFIEMQCRTFQKLLRDDYRFVVFNDSVETSISHSIKEVCARWNIECIDVPQEIHTRPYLKREPSDPLHRPNIRHCNCIQYSLDTLGFYHNGPVVILDSDIFLIRPLSVRELLEDTDILAPVRGSSNKVYYLWPGLTFLAMDRLPDRETLNFNCGSVNGASVDSGGHTYEYLIKHPNVRLKNANELFSYTLGCPDRFVPDHVIDKTPIEEQEARYLRFGFNKKEINFLFRRPHTINFALDNHFLHYRAGSNYDNQNNQYEMDKSVVINEFIDDVLSEF